MALAGPRVPSAASIERRPARIFAAAGEHAGTHPIQHEENIGEIAGERKRVVQFGQSVLGEALRIPHVHHQPGHCEDAGEIVPPVGLEQPPLVDGPPVLGIDHPAPCEPENRLGVLLDPSFQISFSEFVQRCWAILGWMRCHPKSVQAQ